MSTEYFRSTLIRRDVLLNRALELLESAKVALTRSETLMLSDIFFLEETDAFIADATEEMENNQ